jgi:putative FmdB family regulatory protein
MPIYEYCCTKCDAEFEEIVLKDDETVRCPRCGASETRKLMSACRTRISGPEGAAAPASGGGCASCGGGSCATC